MCLFCPCSERYTCETMSVVPHVALTEPVQLVLDLAGAMGMPQS